MNRTWKYYLDRADYRVGHTPAQKILPVNTKIKRKIGKFHR